MTERIPTPEAAENNERINTAAENLALPALEEQVSRTLEEFPTLQGMATEDAEAVLRSKVQAVYEVVRDHIDAIEERVDPEAPLMSDEEFKGVVERMFTQISRVTSEDGERMNFVRVDLSQLPEIDTLVGMYRNLLERTSN